MIPSILTVGHACLDIVHKVPRIPLPNTKVSSREVDIRIGGNAANCAAALSEMGARVDLCTVLGSDDHPFTRILISLLRSAAVGTSLCRFDPTQPCPSSTIMVMDDGERAIMNWQGEEIRSGISLPSSLDGYNMIQADAYRLPMVRQVFMMARKSGIPTMIDIDSPVDDIGLLPSADHVWFSHESWRKQRIPLRDLQARLGGIVGITDGDRPVSWIGLDGRIRYHQPPTVIARNTLGAGDVFRARLGLGICIGEPIETAVEKACISACEHITDSPLTKVIS